ncbi:MAG: diaminopropionate ammonia-lyase [Gammaproteobacteria bacterium]|jgi:diaminopropionate ammonia-lyase
MFELGPYESALLAHCANPRVRGATPWPKALDQGLSEHMVDQALAAISAWPGYAPTPMHWLGALAQTLGIAHLSYKDEGSRFGLGSFKALGGAYAVTEVIRSTVQAHLGHAVSGADILSQRYLEQARTMTVTSATDGNHGRSVAWGATRCGCRAVIYIHAQVSDAREQALANLGAEVVRVSGNYDASVAQAARDAHTNGWHLVADTAHAGYEAVPLLVMAGYGVLVDEILAQAGHDKAATPARETSPTHVFVQGGVGGLAGAMCARLWQRLGSARPRLIVIEPALADCLYKSACAGIPTVVDIENETVMAGLSCGEVSPVAWPILDAGAHDFLTIDDALVAPTMRLLADGTLGAAPIVAGESAVAGLAGAIASAMQPALRSALGLNSASRVLILGSEGATDAGIYEEMVGRSPDQVITPSANQVTDQLSDQVSGRHAGAN